MVCLFLGLGKCLNLALLNYFSLSTFSVVNTAEAAQLSSSEI